MKKLTKAQLSAIEAMVRSTARPLEQAKWSLLRGKGTKEAVVEAILPYQNEDGGFGNALEPDIATPESSATASAEALFTARKFDLSLSDPWAKRLLGYFEASRKDIPGFWEPAPPSVERYPHPPWWGYEANPPFGPNPGAVAAAALLSHGTESQKALAQGFAARCITFLLEDTKNQDHDNYCLQHLCVTLAETGSPLWTAEVEKKLGDRLMGCVCRDPALWGTYVAQPLDLVDSPESPWYPLLADAIPANIEYWIDTFSAEGCWTANFSWGEESDASRKAMEAWRGCMAVNRVRILMAFGAVEE